MQNDQRTRELPMKKNKLTKEQQQKTEAAIAWLLSETDNAYVRQWLDCFRYDHTIHRHEPVSRIDRDTLEKSPAFIAFIKALPDMIAAAVQKTLPMKLEAETKRLKKKMLVGKVLSKISDNDFAEFKKTFYIGDVE